MIDEQEMDLFWFVVGSFDKAESEPPEGDNQIIGKSKTLLWNK